MSYHKRSWESRYAQLGDQAEARCEEYLKRQKRGYIRSGLCRPPLQVSKLDLMERYRPDFLTSRGYVEAKGMGRDQLLKIKVENLEALWRWEAIMPVQVFVYDSHKDRHCILDLEEVDLLIEEWGEVGVFPDNHKQYWSIPAERIFRDV